MAAALPAAQQRRVSHKRRLSSHAASSAASLAAQPTALVGHITSFLPLGDVNALFSVSQTTAAASRDDANVWRPLVSRDFPARAKEVTLPSGAGRPTHWKQLYFSLLVKRAARRLAGQTIWICAVNNTHVTFHFLLGGGTTPVPGVEMDAQNHNLHLHVENVEQAFPRTAVLHPRVENVEQAFPRTAALHPPLFHEGSYRRRVDKRDMDPEWWGSQFLWSLLTTLYEDMIWKYVPDQAPQNLMVTAITDVALFREEEHDEEKADPLGDVPQMLQNIKILLSERFGSEQEGPNSRPWTDLVLTARGNFDELQLRWHVSTAGAGPQVGGRGGGGMLPFTVATNNSVVAAHTDEGLNEAELLHLFSVGRRVAVSYSIVYYLGSSK